jgi:hypothetical protein
MSITVHLLESGSSTEQVSVLGKLFGKRGWNRDKRQHDTANVSYFFGSSFFLLHNLPSRERQTDINFNG